MYWMLTCFSEQLQGAETSLGGQQSLNYSRNFQSITEPKGWLLCSRQPVTSPYPESDESSPHSHILLLWNPVQYYHSIYVLLFLVVTFLQVFLPRVYKLFFAPMHVTHLAHFTFLDLLVLIISGKAYKLWSSSLCRFFQNLSIGTLIKTFNEVPKTLKTFHIPDLNNHF
jgi:hypothetical protein